jgi:hypothetical protein
MHMKLKNTFIVTNSWSPTLYCDWHREKEFLDVGSMFMDCSFNCAS